MPKLYFRIQSDYDKVVKLREEIKRLKVELSSIDSNKYKNAAEQVNHKINESTKELKSLTEQAAKNASVMDGAFKTKIYNSSKAVNELTLKIIQQKSVLKGIEGDVSKMKIAYDKLGHFSPKRNEMLKEINSAKIALNEEKAALFGLQTQQSMAKLKTKELRDEYSLYNKNANEMTATTEKVGFSLSKAFAVVGGIALAKQLVNQIITIRGQFRSMEIGMNTMLGEEKGGKLTSEVKDYARESPLNLKDIMAGTQTMVGFNLEAEKVPRYIRAIGDISQGNSQKFNSLTLAFSQMSATGKLMGQDLLQMINAGFNPLSIMAEKAGKSIGELKGEMSKGAISAEMVQQAFIDATSAGGKFFNMSKNASKEIEGQLSMLGDSIDRSLNEMGANSEGMIMAGIKGTTALVDNYEIVGKT
ncbi:MAG: tape measure protein, partial [Bacteroidales bacterium]